METAGQPDALNTGLDLETFLVEWKHVLMGLGPAGKLPLETFLVEWKQFPPRAPGAGHLSLKPS